MPDDARSDADEPDDLVDDAEERERTFERSIVAGHERLTRTLR